MDDTTKLLSISKILEKMIAQVANEIFYTYKDTFLLEDHSYIIGAVWGTVKDGKLDSTQKKIHQKTRKLVEKSISAFSIKDMGDPQAFAIRYLVNTNIIFKVSFMIENARNKTNEDIINADNMLKNMNPPGRLS